MFKVYILKNKDSRVYIGQTNDLSRRLSQHNDPLRKGWANHRGPWVVVATKDFATRIEAISCEKFLKSLKNKDKIFEIIAGWRSSTSTGS